MLRTLCQSCQDPDSRLCEFNEVGNKFVVDSISASFWLYARPVTWLIFPLVQKKNEHRGAAEDGLRIYQSLWDAN
jgi:hypothetical protein